MERIVPNKPVGKRSYSVEEIRSILNIGRRQAYDLCHSGAFRIVKIGRVTINADNVVFHSLRHTSTGVKLRLSKGDLKAVQGDGGWNTPDMIAKRYAHILDEDRRRLAEEMEIQFYQAKREDHKPADAQDLQAVIQLLASNPELLQQALVVAQLANKK